MLWIGLISGTSADAVDAALVRIPDTIPDLELLALTSTPLDEELRKQIHRASTQPIELRDLLRLDREIGERFAEAASQVLRQAGVAPDRVEGIGSHGQTVAHHPEPSVRGTLQLGAPSVIHERTGIPVVADFRSADLAAGGEGAPLTPFLHHALFADAGECRAVLNIGGFCNVSYLPGTDAADVIAFDPGPGNAWIDRAVRAASRGAERFDRDGAGCARGRVLEDVLAELLADPYFEAPPPKSTGHEYFTEAWFERVRSRALQAGASPDDLLATLAALTVESVVVSAERFFRTAPERWLVYGGGVHNAALMQGLRRRLAPAAVETTEARGLPADGLEAITFAVLGCCAARGIPANVPAATGAAHPVVLGTRLGFRP